MRRLLLFACLAIPLHAGLVSSTCIADGITCSSSDAVNTPLIDGSTTYTYLTTTSGALVGGKPTLGTFAQMTVDDVNGVPTLAVGNLLTAHMTFTDSVTAAPAAVYQFDLGLHVINSLGYFNDGFYDAFTQIGLNVQAFDSVGANLWSHFYSPPVIRVQGTTTQPLTYTTPNFGFLNGDLARLDLTLTLTSGVSYANLAGPLHTNATHVVASSDASHTLSLNTIQAGNGIGGVVPMTFTSLAGANYSNAAAVPEPASCGLVLAGAGLLFLRKQRRRRN
jgi:hypothetical protein